MLLILECQKEYNFIYFSILWPTKIKGNVQLRNKKSSIDNHKQKTSVIREYVKTNITYVHRLHYNTCRG